MKPHWREVTIPNAIGRPWTVDVWIAEIVTTHGRGPAARDTRAAKATEVRHNSRDVPVRRLPDGMLEDIERAVEQAEGEYFDGFAWD